MSRKYINVEGLTEIIRERKVAGETNREIGESYGLNKRQVEQLINRQNRKEQLLAVGYTKSNKLYFTLSTPQNMVVSFVAQKYRKPPPLLVFHYRKKRTEEKVSANLL